LRRRSRRSERSPELPRSVNRWRRLLLDRLLRHQTALALVLLLLPGIAAAETRVYVVDPARSQIRFHATSRFMDADGAFHRFGGEIRLEDGRPETAAGQLTVEVASIDTGIGMRDNHLRSADFFDAERHSQATFVATAVRPEGTRLVVSGELTIRGVTRPLTVPVAVSVTPDSLRITGDLSVNRREFGVAYQSRLNPVADDVKVSVDITAVAR
jgi:polyisoprenoid-binding protein YceI